MLCISIKLYLMLRIGLRCDLAQPSVKTCILKKHSLGVSASSLLDRCVCDAASPIDLLQSFFSLLFLFAQRDYVQLVLLIISNYLMLRISI